MAIRSRIAMRNRRACPERSRRDPCASRIFSCRARKFSRCPGGSCVGTGASPVRASAARLI